MIKPLKYLLLLVFVSSTMAAQEERRLGFQTNMMSLLRPVMPSLNLGLMIEDGKRQYTIETDLGFYVPTPIGIFQDEYRLNNFTSQYRGRVSLDVTGGVHWFINQNKTIYHGLRGNIGYFSFNHRQTVCVDAETVAGICVCNEIKDHRFSTSHVRFGVHYRVGFITPLKNKNELEISFDVGVFGIVRNNTSAVGQHDVCSSVSARDSDPLFPFMYDLVGNIMFDFDRQVQHYARFNFVYRFML
jgi:hypothetical protein